MRTKNTQTTRQLRAGENLRHILSEILLRGKIHDFSDVSYLTINEVRMSPDLKNATIFISSFAKDKSDYFIEKLESLSPYLKKEISCTSSLRYVPRLKFKLDQTLDQADRINKLLNSPHVRQDITNSIDD